VFLLFHRCCRRWIWPTATTTVVQPPTHGIPSTGLGSLRLKLERVACTVAPHDHISRAATMCLSCPRRLVDPQAGSCSGEYGSC
jgi:hypothetical protein